MSTLATATEEQYTLTFNSSHGFKGSLPNVFAIRMPSNIIPDLSMHLKGNLAPLCIEVQSLFINGFNNVDDEAICIRKIIKSDVDGQTPTIDEVKLQIPADVYSLDGLLTVINLLAENIFRLDKDPATNNIYLVSLIQDDVQKTLHEAFLVMSHALAAKLGFVKPKFSTYTKPHQEIFSLLPSTCSEEEMSSNHGSTVAPIGQQGDGSLQQTAYKTKSQSLSSPTTRGRNIDESTSTSNQVPLLNQLSIVNQIGSKYHFKARVCVKSSQRANLKTDDGKLILERGRFQPNLYCNLGKIDLIIENDHLQALPVPLFTPTFSALKGQAHLGSFFLSSQGESSTQTHFLFPNNTKKTWIDLKSSYVTFKLLDSCGSLFPLDAEGECQLTIKVTKTIYD